MNAYTTSAQLSAREAMQRTVASSLAPVIMAAGQGDAPRRAAGTNTRATAKPDRVSVTTAQEHAELETRVGALERAAATSAATSDGTARQHEALAERVSRLERALEHEDGAAEPSSCLQKIDQLRTRVTEELAALDAKIDTLAERLLAR